MKDEGSVINRTWVKPAETRRISWPAIWAGLFVSVAIYLLLSVLGISIGATIINPFDQRSAQQVGLGEGIWMIVMSFISLFFGGWVASRLSGYPHCGVGALHGLVTWALTVVAALVLLTTATGKSLIGTVVPMLPAATQALLEVNPNAPTPTGRAGTIGGQNPSPELSAALDRMFASDAGQINAGDRQAVVNLLVSQNNLSRDQANRTVDRLVQNRQQPGASAPPNLGQAARGASIAGWVGFITLALGALAACAGGSRGTRETVYTNRAPTAQGNP